MQLADPPFSLYVPALQFVHWLEFCAENFPALQGSHSADPSDEKFPAGHLLHDSDFKDGEYNPAEQFKHSFSVFAASLGPYFPASHGTQWLLFDALKYVPFSQATQYDVLFM